MKVQFICLWVVRWMLVIDMFFVWSFTSIWVGFTVGLTQELLWITLVVPITGLYAGVWISHMTYTPGMTPGQKVRDS